MHSKFFFELLKGGDAWKLHTECPYFVSQILTYYISARYFMPASGTYSIKVDPDFNTISKVFIRDDKFCPTISK